LLTGVYLVFREKGQVLRGDRTQTLQYLAAVEAFQTADLPMERKRLGLAQVS
jgi:hypothetical protein